MNQKNLRLAGVGVGVLVALLLPHILYPVLALDIMIWGLFAVALDLLLGFAGLLSFGHAAFFGTGAYATGIVAQRLGFPFPIAALTGMVLATLLALPIGYLAVRRKGIYFAMVTLAFAQMVYYVANDQSALTGGENGLQGIPRTLFGVDLSDATTFYYAALPLIFLGLFFAYRTTRSPFGHVLVAIRDNEARAKALGYPADRYKLIAFLISGALSGLAGGLLALNHGFAALKHVHWGTSGEVVMMTILGGIGTLWGGVAGAAVVLWLQDFLSTWTDAWGVVTGTIFVVSVLSFRKGIWGTFVSRVWDRHTLPASPGYASSSDDVMQGPPDGQQVETDKPRAGSTGH